MQPIMPSADVPRTLSELLSCYLATKQLSYSTRTLTENAFKHLNRMLAQEMTDQSDQVLMGAVDFRGLTKDHAERYRAWLLSRLSKNSARIYMKTIRPVFGYAHEHLWVENNVFAIKPPKRERRAKRIFTVNEFTRMLISSRDEISRARLMLGRTCGMRKGEVLHLTTSDIDFERGVLYVQSKRETKYTVKWEPKDREMKTLPLVECLVHLLARIVNELPDGQSYVLLYPDRYRRIQEMQAIGTLNDRVRLNLDENFRHWFTRILEYGRVPHGTFHDLRKTYTTDLAEQGVPVHWAQALLGHSKLETTVESYIDVRQEPMLKAARSAMDHTMERVEKGPWDEEDPKSPVYKNHPNRGERT